MPNVFVAGGFDDLKSRHLRFLEESAKLGAVHVWLWPDELIARLTGKPPKFPVAERRYLLESVRFVHAVAVAGPDASDQEMAWATAPSPNGAIWAVPEEADSAAKRAFAQRAGLAYRVIRNAELAGFPEIIPETEFSGARKVIVTGCYDWFHSGHVRFFEEVSQLGDLYVVVGHDANVRLLKGEGHPLFCQEERRYIVGAIRFVKQALVSTGHGWLDAEPEIQRLRPDVYAVNEDGDKPEKRQYCQEHGLEYAVLKRTPKEGLPRRQSTDLRGF